VDAIPVILSEIVRDEGWFMSQYMRSLTCPMALRGTFGAGPPACIPTVVVELNMHDGAEGPSAHGLQPASPTPVLANFNHWSIFVVKNFLFS
jgi:hypothetical protein